MLNDQNQGRHDMTDNCAKTKLTIGTTVPDFKLETYDPAKGDFSEISLDTLRKDKKWTVLFFYPADFTFV